MSPDDAMYEPFAEAFSEHAEHSAYNALYDRPVTLDLIGDVAGLDVLDAGCGPGYYARDLADRGARVTAFDASPTLVKLTAQRLGGRGEARVASLEETLWLPDASQDLVVLALVIHHVKDRANAIAELHRVLRPGGHLVVSTTHPTWDWQLRGGSYFEPEWVQEAWHGGAWQVGWQRQTLQAWCDELTAPGFVIERIVEHQPEEGMAKRFPTEHSELSTRPAFIGFRLRR